MRTALALLALLGAIAFAWFAGAARSDATCKLTRAEEVARNAGDLALLSESYRRTERALRGQLDIANAHHQQELARRERSTIDLAARLRAGAVRVSVPVAACEPTRADSAAGPAAATPRAELAPETSIALDRIAADGDAAILDLNACLAAYEAARAAVAATGATER